MTAVGLPVLPTPWTVEHTPYEAGVEDPYGNVTPGWGTPVTLAVHGWAPPSAGKEPFEAGRDVVAWDLDLYAPAGTTVHPHDRLVVDGLEYEVVGYEEDYTKGPWQWPAGVRINLQRTEG